MLRFKLKGSGSHANQSTEFFSPGRLGSVTSALKMAV
jgi:hypothetical protein